jgi:hypothetical protein
MGQGRTQGGPEGRVSGTVRPPGKANAAARGWRRGWRFDDLACRYGSPPIGSTVLFQMLFTTKAMPV